MTYRFLTLGALVGPAMLLATAPPVAAQPRLGGPDIATAEDQSYMHAAPPSVSVGPRTGATGGSPPEISLAAAAAKKAGVDCRVATGLRLRADARGALYEVACRGDFGWQVAQAPDGSTAAVSCLAQAGASKGFGHCLLRENRNQLAGLQALVDKAKASCHVTDGVWIGSGGNPPIIRYEATCTDGGGYILDAPQPGAPSDLIATACKDAPPLGLKCTLPPTLTGPPERPGRGR